LLILEGKKERKRLIIQYKAVSQKLFTIFNIKWLNFFFIEITNIFLCYIVPTFENKQIKTIYLIKYILKLLVELFWSDFLIEIFIILHNFRF
jgi:hypothetical protein